jgi:hypothetical protein
MKLNKSMLVVVAMMVGAFGATGCNRASDVSGEAVAPEENAAEAPVEDEKANDNALPGAETRHSVTIRYYAPYAPPAVRYERPGRAPSSRHFWTPGYYRWNGRQHVWYNGRWEGRRHGHEYIGPRWVNVRGRWEYIPGHWVRR